MSRPLIFGMVHLRALPGTPLNKLPYREIKKIGKKTKMIIQFIWSELVRTVDF